MAEMASATTPVMASARPDARVGRSRQGCRSIAALIAAACDLWRTQTAPELASRARVATRTAERWLEGRYALSAPALAALLQSEEGLTFLTALMDEARPRWWRQACTMLAIADVRARQATDQRALRKLQEAIDAEALVSQSIARAELVLDATAAPRPAKMVRGADRRRDLSAAPVARAGDADRALAPARRQGVHTRFDATKRS
jgi:hypothetical protein